MTVGLQVEVCAVYEHEIVGVGLGEGERVSESYSPGKTGGCEVELVC